MHSSAFRTTGVTMGDSITNLVVYISILPIANHAVLSFHLLKLEKKNQSPENR